MGRVYFDKIVVESKNKDGYIVKVPIVRKEKNIRERPEGHERQANANIVREEANDLDLINKEKDLQWLAWSWFGMFN